MAKLAAVLVAVFALSIGSATAQTCSLDQCGPGTVRCFDRNVFGEPNFICECGASFRIGHDCLTIADNRDIFTCYGSDCSSGVFSSLNYPNGYPFRYIAIYLIYIPGAEEIVFQFDSPFGLESPKDELYIGRGVEPNIELLDRTSRPEEDLYFFDGRDTPPNTYSVFSDTAFLYFLTDKNIEYEGFRVRWNIVDNVVPVIICPDDIVRQITTGNANGGVINWALPTASDNSGQTPTIILTSSQGPGSFFQFGEYSVSYRATDAAGNFATCSFSVMVEDRVPPVIQGCPTNDILREVDFSAESTNAFWQTITATDNSGFQPTLSNTHNSGEVFLVGQTSVVYTFSDQNGNSAICSFNVIVQRRVDNVAPVITCPDNIFRQITTGNINGGVINWDLPTASDNSGQTPTVTLTSSQAPPAFFQFGVHTVSYSATDAAGNVATCSFTVTLEDRVQPVIVGCPTNDVLMEVDFNIGSANVFWQTITATDNSGFQPTLNSNFNSGDVFSVGQTNVVYTFTDQAGNSAVCSFNVIVRQRVDNVAPVITCPDNIFRQITTGNINGGVINWDLPTASDNSGQTPTVTLTSSQAPPAFFQFGVHTVSYSATDAAGNVATCSFTVTLVDNVSPQFTFCPDNILQQFEADGFTSGATVTWTTPTANDNSGGNVQISQTSGPQSGSFFTVGQPITIVYTATDLSANSATCSFTVTVTSIDTTPPTFTSCPQDISQTIPLGSTSVFVQWNIPTATDTSGGQVTVENLTQNPGQFTAGTYTIRYQARDPAGNTAECTFDLFITQQIDNVPPQFTFCPDNILQQFEADGFTSGATVTWTTPTASDNSGGNVQISQTSGPQSGSFFTVGQPITIVYTATDLSANSATCSFTVTVSSIDTTPPTFTSCPQDISQTIPLGSTSVFVQWNNPTATDTSGGQVIVENLTQNPGQFTAGTYTIRYQARDTAGNTAECTFNVFITQQIDNVPPQFTFCPDNILQQFEADGFTSGATVTWTTPTASDNSGGNVQISQTPGPQSGSFFTVGQPITIVYTATDLSGNSATCSFTVTVSSIDTTPPTFTSCPQDISQTIPLGSTSVFVQWNNPTATDTSGGQVIVENLTQNPGQFTAGTYTIRYQARDPASNTAECTFNVFITQQIDNVPPQFTFCPDNILQQFEADGFTSGATVTWTTPTANDNSGGNVQISQTPGPQSGSFFTVGQPITIVYTATDLSGNSATCSFTVTVTSIDTTPPVFTSCPQDISQTIPLGSTSVFVQWNIPTATDTSGGQVTVENLTQNPGQFTAGTYTIRYQARDPAGNTAECTFDVLITQQIDNIPPQFTFCPDNILQQFEADGFTSGAIVTWTTPTANDNSGGNVQISRTSGPLSGSFFTVGQPITIEYTATDLSGNSATCSFTVTVTSVDTTPPVFSNCPQDISQTIPLGSTSVFVQWNIPTATDTSGGQVTVENLTQNPGQFTAGTYTIRYQARDTAGNTAECTFNVVITQQIDNIPPQFTFCPDNILQQFEADGFTSGATVTWTTPTANDNSGGNVQISLTSGPLSGSFFTVGQPITIEYTATDPSGNSATCSFTVTVTSVDTTPPVFSNCPQDISQTIPLGSTSVFVQWNIPTATDTSRGQVTVENLTQNPGQFTAGTYTIRYQARDTAGNTAECTFNVVITQQIDNVPPQFTFCPDNILQQFEADGFTSGATVTWTTPTANDNSGGNVQISLTSGPPSGAFFVVGQPTTIVYTATDLSGNSATCSFTVTVTSIDTTPPVFTSCPQDISQTIPLGSTSVFVQWNNPTATDTSGGQVTVENLTQNPGQFTAGTYTIRYQARDPAGNTAECTFNVVITQQIDNIPPQFTSCPDNILQQFEADGFTSGAIVTWTTPTANDNSGGNVQISQTSGPQSGSFFTVGQPITIVYTATDLSGNSATCSFTVTVTSVDTTPPTFTSCPQDISQTIPLGSTSVFVQWNNPTATDTSGGQVTVENLTQNPGQFTAGTYTIRYQARDPAGNTAECTFNVVITQQIDNIPPQFTFCPSDNIFQQFEADRFTSGATVTWTTPTANDNSGGNVQIIQTSGPQSGSFFTVGQPITIVYTATDLSGNSATCSFTVTVASIDTTPPVFTNCPQDISQTIPLGSTSVFVQWNIPTATDTSGSQVTVENLTQNPGQFTAGTYTIRYQARDPAGNTAECTFNVVVTQQIDNIPPQFTFCPTDQFEQFEVDGSTNGVTVSWQAPTANDNSGGTVQITQVQGPQSGSFFPVGQTTTIEYRATDPSGNTATCSFTVTVTQTDTTNPVFTSCPTDISRTIPIGSTSVVVPWNQPTATDNSGVPPTIVNLSQSPGQFSQGTYVIRYQATDAAGNTALCTFTITITQEIDNIPPQFVTCPNDIFQQYEVDGTTTGVVVNWAFPTANDNSGQNVQVVLTSSPQPGSFFTVGQTTITYTASDTAGNTATCTFTVFVTEIDTTPPVFTSCPPDISQTIPLGSTSVFVQWSTPTATDNSGVLPSLTNLSQNPGQFTVGTYQIRYQATDAAGNNAICSFTVTVTQEVDTTPPVFTNCPPDISQTIPLGSTSVFVQWNIPTATDNSGVQPTVINLSQNPGQFTVGTYQIRYQATDAAGNNAICLFTVTVTQEVDTIPPEIQFCPPNINQEIPFGVTSTIVTWNQPTATDNSGQIPTVQASHTSGASFGVGLTVVTYTFSDLAGNTNICRFEVSVTSVDRTPPQVIFCPNDISRTILRGSGPVVITWQEPTASDNSGIQPTVTSSHNSGDFFSSTVSTSITYTFTDAAGNSAICTFTITITEVNPCDFQQCQNGGVCIADTLQTIYCLCPACFSGDQCQIALDGCQGNQCQNGAQCIAVAGSCTAYQCQCTPCFSGTFCTEGVDSCLNHQCNNGATCTINANNCLLYTCNCPPCFEGQFCEIPINPCANHNCQNGGACNPITSNSVFSCTEYKCVCPPCFIGEFCSQPRDPCQPNPCSNGGQCSQLQDSCFSYTCQCTGCFTGYNCQIVVASPCQTNPCINGGVCEVVQGACTTAVCRCPTGFNGIFCENVVTTNPNPCNSFPCENGGNCLTMDGSYYICLCSQGYVGQNCQFFRATTPNAVDACLTGPCRNGATCINSYNSISNILFGTAQTYSCICQNGFTGVNCGVQTINFPQLSICELGTRPPCTRGGTCFNMFHNFDQDVDYFCNCPTGFTGHNCELQVPDACSGLPCQNGGQCQVTQNAFVCVCPAGFTGQQCEISMVDTQPPVITGCPSPISQTTVNSNGQAIFWTPPTATDNSGSATLVYQTHNPGSFFPPGTTLVTYIFGDSSLNYDFCQFYVTLTVSSFDTTAPSISNCPFGPTVNALPGFTSATVTWDEPTATDNSGQQPQLTRSHTPGSVFTLGYTAVAYTFRDAAGNQATCSFLVNVVGTSVVDQTPPVISGCDAAATSRTAPAGVTSLVVFWTEPTATDNSGQQVTVSKSHNPGDTFAVGQTTTVTYIFIDASGNRATCMFSVTVTSSGTGAVNVNGCPVQGVTVTAPASATTSPVVWTEPTATDSLGQTITNIVQSHQPGSLFPVGQTTQVTYTFTANSGSQGQCIFSVTVTRSGTGAVNINGCPVQGVTVTAPASATTSPVVWTEPTATDSLGQTITNIVRSHQPGSLFPVGQTTQVTYTFTANSGSQGQCIFSVTVTRSGTGAVNINGCPVQGVVITAPVGATTSPVVWTEPTATDSLGQTITNIARSHQPGSSFLVGQTTQVTYTFTANSGSQGQCIFAVTVIPGTSVDNEAPILTVPCPNGLTVTAPAGATNFPVSWNPPMAIDNSGSVNTLASHDPGFPFIVGISTTVTYRFTDPSGNFVACSFTVTVTTGVIDTIPPTITGCPSNGVAVTAATGATSATATWQEPVGQDNSGVTPQVIRSHAPGSVFQLGTTTVTYRFVDGSNNEAICSFFVTVSAGGGGDTINPVLTGCPIGVTAYVPAGVTTIRVTWTAPTATDNSGVPPTVESNPAVNSFFQLGATTVTYTATDGSGNRATCTFGVNVIVDTMPPSISGCPSSAIRASLPSSTATSVAVSWTEPQATDNSQLPVNVTRTHAPGDSFGLGTSTVVYTFSDSVNNEAQCSFMVIVSPFGGFSNPCASNPCPAGLSCFFTPTAFLCRSLGRRRRDVDFDETDSCPCMNGGECMHVDDDPPSSFCVCPTGFEGVLCEEVTDVCWPNPCANNGTCEVTVNDHQTAHHVCFCSAGWGGPDCRHAVDDGLVFHSNDLGPVHGKGLLNTEWFIGALVALVVILFLVFAVAMVRIMRHPVSPVSKRHDEVTVIQ